MSFDIIPPSKNLSNVQASYKSCDGGAGNTGYFKRQTQEENEINLKFLNNNSDLFVKSDSFEEEETSFLLLFLKFLSDLIDKIVDFFQKKLNKV